MHLSSSLLSFLPEPLRAVARLPRRAMAGLRNGWDRRLHARRHRRVCESVLTRLPAREILFVCLGNICRSPYAERCLRRRLEAADLGARVDVRSVGFISPGRPSPAHALEAARERGIDLSDHRSTVLTNGVLQSADLVFVMTSDQRRDLSWHYGRHDTLHLGDMEPPPVFRRDLPDPVEGPVEEFRAVYARIDRALDTLAGLIGGPSRPVDAGAASNDGSA